MNKKEVKQTLLVVSFNKIKDLISDNKINEAQVVVELLNAQLKEIDNSYNEDMSFKIGDFVTLDDPNNRAAIDINSYKDICYLDNVYKVKDIDRHCIYLRSIRNRYEASGKTIGLLWHNPDEIKRMTKLHFKNHFVVTELYNKD